MTLMIGSLFMYPSATGQNLQGQARRASKPMNSNLRSGGQKVGDAREQQNVGVVRDLAQSLVKDGDVVAGQHLGGRQLRTRALVRLVHIPANVGVADDDEKLMSHFFLNHVKIY